MDLNVTFENNDDTINIATYVEAEDLPHNKIESPKEGMLKYYEGNNVNECADFRVITTVYTHFV